jgi:membrane protease YdiL (CAAX protease family)
VTFAGVWFDREAGEGALFVIAVIALAGIPYALLHRRTRSLVPPFAAHLAASTAIMLASLQPHP